MALLGNWLVLGMLAPLIAWSICYGNPPVSDRALCLIYAVSAALAGYLLLPPLTSPLAEARLGLWSVLTMLSAWLLMAQHASGYGAVLPALAAGVLVFLLGSIAGLGAALCNAEQKAHLWIFILLILTAAGPLWLGPVVEAGADSATRGDVVVALSPLSYLAVMAGDDYLRSAWFYRRTPLGVLPYQYPTATAFSSAYLLLASACLGVRRYWLRKQRKHLSSLEKPSITN